MINLNKKEYFYLGNKFYIIKKGSVCVRNVLGNYSAMSFYKK